MTLTTHLLLYLPIAACCRLLYQSLLLPVLQHLRPEVVVQLQLFLSPAEPVLRDQLASHATKHDTASHSLFYNEEQTLCVLSGESERV